MGVKCKTLFSAEPEGAEKPLRHWLEERAGRITIRTIAADANYYGFSVAVFFTEESGPQYRLSVLSARKHDALEEQVNHVLANAATSGTPMVAMGSNQLGHCLFLLWESGS